MDFSCHSHRFGERLLKEEYSELQREIFGVIGEISDEDIIQQHEKFHVKQKSISMALNDLFKSRFTGLGWRAESPIFQDLEYSSGREKVWRLDFAKDAVSIEVAYNHGEALAWNLLKPVLASELNHVEKAIQTDLGVVILATEELKEAGGFDGAVGTYEKAIRYLQPLRAQLTVPLVLIGLRAPASFKMEKTKRSDGRGVVGEIVRF